MRSERICASAVARWRPPTGAGSERSGAAAPVSEPVKTSTTGTSRRRISSEIELFLQFSATLITSREARRQARSPSTAVLLLSSRLLSTPQPFGLIGESILQVVIFDPRTGTNVPLTIARCNDAAERPSPRAGDHNRRMERARRYVLQELDKRLASRSKVA